jgi:SAM-dependent MidA family methyltransferase
MELALYDPAGGFFSTGVLRSEKAGDFLTSPEVSAAFGQTLATYVTSEHDRLGQPQDFTVVEVGAGSGSLLGPLLETLPFEPHVVAVEASPAARESLVRRVLGISVLAPEESLETISHGVVLANELLDNLPMALAVREASGWTERWVTEHEGVLALTAVTPRPEVIDWLTAWAGPVEDGGIVEVQLAAVKWLSAMAATIGEGSIVAIDYGDTAELLEPRRAGGTLRTYRAHHLGPHPLDEPGATDITADVNFTALLGAGELLGLDCSLHRQDDFLNRLGLRERLGALRHEELALARGNDTMARLIVRNEISEIETIVHPRGLGDFRAFVARVGEPIEPSETS